jgi:membrane fusion protein (multidrug efflux system)
MRPLRFVVLALIVWGCKGGAKSTADEGPAVSGVRTAVAELQTFPQTVNAIGTVAVRPDRFASLAAPGPTRVARVYVVVGQRVAKGDSLVAFERAPFDAAAQSAGAALANAERAFARATRLAQAGILPQKDADQAAADLAAAQAAAVTARRSQELATLRAPISGVVTEMSAVLGSSVDPSQALVQIADPRALDIVFNVSPAEAARIHIADTLALSSGEGAQRESLGSATVVSVAVAVDSASRAVAVRARPRQTPRDSTARPLRLGESVFGHIVTSAHANAVTVPIEALVPEGDGFRVYVVDSAGIAHIRPVTVGARTETRAEILSGLAAGETIVTTGAYGVTDSAKIGPSRP